MQADALSHWEPPCSINPFWNTVLLLEQCTLHVLPKNIPSSPRGNTKPYCFLEYAGVKLCPVLLLITWGQTNRNGICVTNFEDCWSGGIRSINSLLSVCQLLHFIAMFNILHGSWTLTSLLFPSESKMKKCWLALMEIGAGPDQITPQAQSLHKCRCLSCLLITSKILFMDLFAVFSPCQREFNPIGRSQK